MSAHVSKLVAAGALSLSAFNRALYRCTPEESVEQDGGPYDVPGHGQLVFCGLQGVVNVFDRLRPQDNLGHPLCHNLRQGNWLLDYQVSMSTSIGRQQWFPSRNKFRVAGVSIETMCGHQVL